MLLDALLDHGMRDGNEAIHEAREGVELWVF
jgi:hypothetical protein